MGLQHENVQGGLVVMGVEYATLTLRKRADSFSLSQTVCHDAQGEGGEVENGSVELGNASVILKAEVTEGALCSFSYSIDGRAFTAIGQSFPARPEAWTGAKVGLFCTLPSSEKMIGNDYLDVDWFRIESLR
jgi:hypothetical protein